MVEANFLNLFLPKLIKTIETFENLEKLVWSRRKIYFLKEGKEGVGVGVVWLKSWRK